MYLRESKKRNTQTAEQENNDDDTNRKKLAETKLSLIYTFADMRNRINSLVASYCYITGENSFLVRKLQDC